LKANGYEGIGVIWESGTIGAPRRVVPLRFLQLRGCRNGWEKVDWRGLCWLGTWAQSEKLGDKNNMLKGLILGILLGILLIAGGVYVYFSSGRAPVATSAPPIPFERKLAGVALHAYLDKLPHPEPQVPVDETNLLSGAKVYKEQCAMCHGLPGEPKGAIQAGMFPAPPQLFHGIGVTDDDAWESYWKVENGIRLSGMPGFKDSLTEKQIWEVAVLVKNADKIPESVKKELAAGATTPMEMAMPSNKPVPAKK
jgi:thiosulfate dehydrogenase